MGTRLNRVTSGDLEWPLRREVRNPIIAVDSLCMFVPLDR